VSATAAPPTDGTACPRCGAHVAPNQDWCLSCGDAARTRLVPTPNWRLPIAMVAIVCALALLAIAVAFVQLTRDDAPVTPTTPAATTPTAAPPATTAQPTTTAPPTATTTTPGATTPGATTPGATTPGATTPAPGQTTTTTP
jgi:cytoskeletal protein RodZ